SAAPAGAHRKDPRAADEAVDPLGEALLAELSDRSHFRHPRRPELPRGEASSRRNRLAILRGGSAEGGAADSLFSRPSDGGGVGDDDVQASRPPPAPVRRLIACPAANARPQSGIA